MFVVSIGLLSVGCCGDKAVKKANAASKAATYAEALKLADKSCKTDADCTSVKKGCCMCDGNEAVNKTFAAAIQPVWEKDCAMKPCTLQMCYVEINTSCRQGVCTGTPKPMNEYFAN